MRQIVLGVDGLSCEDLVDFVQLLPKSRRYFNLDSPLAVEGSVLTSPQGLWSEVLTSCDWTINGCVGYSHPRRSLNALAVMQERDLFVPPKFAAEETPESRTLSINMPLLMPKAKVRDWLSDGSQPVAYRVKPSKLLTHPELQDYSPRAFSDLSSALGRPSAGAQFIECEKQRIDCAAILMQSRQWQRCFWRMSVFDDLSHFVGMGFLKARDLLITKPLLQLLDHLDDLLDAILSSGEATVHIVSTFSHVACQGMLNLNNLLATGGFFTTEGNENEFRSKTNRMAASLLFTGMDDITNFTLRSHEGQLKTSHTLAASPVSGCIYINAKEYFDDGIVDAHSRHSIHQRLGSFLHDTLGKKFWGSAKIVENDEQSLKLAAGPMPDFVVSIDGIEFSDQPNPPRSLNDIPRTTHRASGFVLLPANQMIESKAIKPRQVLEVIGV